MSVRGIEIHDGYAILPPLIRPISVGTRYVPITQIGTTLEQVIGAFINTSEVGTGWDMHGVWGWVNAVVDREGDIVGVEGRCYVKAGITVDAKVYGLHSRIYAEALATVGSDFDGLHIAMNTEDDAVLSLNVRAISILNAIRVNPAGSYYVIDFEDSGGQAVDAIINTNVGASGNVAYFLRTVQETDAWNDAGDKTSSVTSAGWIRVRIGGTPLYIALYP